MSLIHLAAALFVTVSALMAAFQLALAAGAPWGEYAMGGAVRGKFPPSLRIAAFAQAMLIVGMAAVVLARAGLVLANWSKVSEWLIWVVVAIYATSLILNLITRSKRERAIGVPAALLLLTSSAFVALQGSA